MNQIRSRARALRKNPTDVERLLWRHLRMWQLDGYKFRRQQPIGNYIVDFVCLEKRLIIELDGGQHVEQLKYDTERDAWLRAQGFSVLRFWNNEVLQNSDGVKQVIFKALQSTPFLNPSPQGGRKRLGTSRSS
jgi:very-short-patch-repair endonuclease